MNQNGFLLSDVSKSTRCSVPFVCIIFITALASVIFFTHTAHAAYEISDGSVKVLYHLTDTSDASGNNHTLTNNNSVSFSSTPSKLGNAASTGSGNSNKTLYTSSTLGIDGGNITVAGWFYFHTVPAGGNVFTFAGQGNGSSNIQYNIQIGSGQWYFQRYAKGCCEQHGTYNSTPQANTWYHVALTYDGTYLRGYVNGSLVIGPTSASGTGSGGAMTGGFEFFNHSSVTVLQPSTW